MSDCLFCKIVAGQIPAKKAHEDELCIGFHDIHPQAPTHVLFIPQKHVATANDLTHEETALVGHLMVTAAKRTSRTKLKTGRASRGRWGPAGCGEGFSGLRTGRPKAELPVMGAPGQTSSSRTSAVDLLDAVRQPARGSEGWAVVGGRMSREGS